MLAVAAVRLAFCVCFGTLQAFENFRHFFFKRITVIFHPSSDRSDFVIQYFALGGPCEISFSKYIVCPDVEVDGKDINQFWASCESLKPVHDNERLLPIHFFSGYFY